MLIWHLEHNGDNFIKKEKRKKKRIVSHIPHSSRDLQNMELKTSTNTSLYVEVCVEFYVCSFQEREDLHPVSKSDPPILGPHI